MFPESELRNMYNTNPDGSVGDYKASTPAIHKAIGDGALKRDYSSIRVPRPELVPSAAMPRYEPMNAQERAAIESFNATTEAYIIRWKKNLQHAPGGVRIVDIPGANHYIFLGTRNCGRFWQA